MFLICVLQNNPPLPYFPFPSLTIDLHLNFESKVKHVVDKKEDEVVEKVIKISGCFFSPLSFFLSGPICMSFFSAQVSPSSLPRYSSD